MQKMQKHKVQCNNVSVSGSVSGSVIEDLKSKDLKSLPPTPPKGEKEEAADAAEGWGIF